MKRFVVISFILIGLALSLIAQDDNDEVEPTIPDFAMKEVVRRVVTWYFKPRNTPRTIYFSGKGIKKEWLPSIRNIEFIVLEKDSPRYDGPVYFFQHPRSLGKGFTIEFGRGDPECHAIGDTWGFHIAGERVHLFQAGGGWGMGCSASAGAG
jgi:hypothetical protein